MKALLKSTFGMVAAVVVLFVAIAVFVARNTSQQMVDQARKTVENLVKATTGQIDRLMTEVETAVANQKWIIGERLDEPDYMYKITKGLVENNEFIVGSTIAFVPNYFPEKGYYWAPYTCDEGGGKLKSFQLGNDDNRYHEQAWFTDPIKAGKAVWSEPYFDEGGAKIDMSTYSMPIRDKRRNICAILTADLSLEQLKEHVRQICPFPNSYAVMNSAQGKPLVSPPEGREVNDGDGKTIRIREQAENGWTVEVVCPIAEIVRGSRRLVRRMTGFAVAGLLLILAVSWLFANRLQRMMVARQRIESELATARSIQSGILQKNFPYSVAANIRPAREVGGDLYDFVERNGLWYFIVGDASGKGVPAALFSFMAGTAFRLACNMGLSPVEIVRHINSVLTDGNDMSMFVTAFVGVLDRDNETLEYCNAGHNPPLVALDGAEAKFLDVKKNLPLGVKTDCPYVAQRIVLTKNSRLVVYTDGVTEAERVDHSQFGEKRLVDFVMAHREDDAAKLMKGICREVDSFADGAEQSDDITVMVIES